MSDVINGVPRSLLERVCSKPNDCRSMVEVNRWSIDQALALGELRALLTAQPQAAHKTVLSCTASELIHYGPAQELTVLTAQTPGASTIKESLTVSEQPQASAAQNQCGECGFPNGAGPHCGYHGAAQSAHHCSNCLGVQPESCMFAQSAPAGAPEGLAAKIEAAKYRLESSRTWAGMQWGLPHLEPRRQQDVLDLLTDAYAMLAAAPAQPAAQRDWPDDEIVAAWKWCEENGGTPAEFLSHSLLVKRSRVLGRPLTWREAIELTAITTNMPDEERDKLLAIDDEPDAAAQDQGEVQRLREALEFYARGDHLLLADQDAWDTCEPNWLRDFADTASVEDGSLARAALAASTGQEV